MRHSSPDTSIPIGSALVGIYIGGRMFPRAIEMYRYALSMMNMHEWRRFMPDTSYNPLEWLLIRIDFDADLAISMPRVCYQHARCIVMAIIDPELRPVPAAAINGHLTFNKDGTRLYDGACINWGINLDLLQTVVTISSRSTSGVEKRRKVAFDYVLPS